MNAPRDLPRKSEPPADRPRSTSERSHANSRGLGWLEKITLAHVGGLLLLGTWFFAGGSTFSRQLISYWGSLALVITVAAIWPRRSMEGNAREPLRWLWPVMVFSALVLASCLNPSFSEKSFEGDSLLAETGAAHPSLPSTAHVATSLHHLWLFGVLYLSAFNLTLVIRRRRTLRGLMLFAAANATVLSVFGSLQKLTSDGLFFGAVKSPNARFFATFVYANHWSAYVVLLAAATGGLIFHYSKRRDGDPRTRSLVVLCVIGLLLMCVTPFVAGSRAGILMAGAVLIAVGLRASFRIWRKQRAHGGLAYLPLTGLAACGILALIGAIWLGRDALEERLSDTREQLQRNVLDSRRELYSDTWTLVKDHPVFGWGLGSYSKVFLLVRPRPLEANRQYERSYADAHSDWLQALAEVGFAGTSLLALAGALPLLGLRRHHLKSAVTTWALGGCALILLYATVEFPFGNAAVVLTWWLCFFSGVQYSRLQNSSRFAYKPRPPAEE